MTKEDSKLFLLKEAFINGEKLSVSDICDLIDIKRSRVYDYLNMLKEEGISLVTEKDGRTVYYMLSSAASDIDLYQPVSHSDILRARIMYELQYNANMKYEELKDNQHEKAIEIQRKAMELWKLLK